MIFFMRTISGLTSTKTGKANRSRRPADRNTFSWDLFLTLNTRRAEKVAEITSWLKSHPVSSVTRTSCELQVLDAAIVEKIEEAVEKVKVTESCEHCPPSSLSLNLCLTPPVGEEEHQESARDGEASPPLQSEFFCPL